MLHVQQVATPASGGERSEPEWSWHEPPGDEMVDDFAVVGNMPAFPIDIHKKLYKNPLHVSLYVVARRCRARGGQADMKAMVIDRFGGPRSAGGARHAASGGGA